MLGFADGNVGDRKAATGTPEYIKEFCKDKKSW
jgi:hypothetical protein